MGFTHEDPEVVKTVREIEGVLNSAIEMSAKPVQDNFMASFAGQLALVAKVLRECNMPQETINMVLAARCGLPMQKVDGKSTYYRWTDDEPKPE